jgi:hypothetical protein
MKKAKKIKKIKKADLKKIKGGKAKAPKRLEVR